jgi:hypothetical protein
MADAGINTWVDMLWQLGMGCILAGVLMLWCKWDVRRPHDDRW